MEFLLRLAVNAVAIFALAWVLSGITVKDFGVAVVAALILALINAFVKPLLVILTIPITIFTLGLFLFVINGLMIWLVSYIVEGFEVRNFWWALLFGFLLGLVNSMFAGNNRRKM